MSPICLRPCPKEPPVNEIRRVVRRAGMRLIIADFLHALIWTLTVAVAGAAVCLIVQRLFAFAMPWREIAIYAPIAAAAIALVWALFTKPAAAAIARRLDEGANLKETLSTALSVAGREDPWCRNVVESASRTAVGVDVRRALPFHAPRAWPAPLVAGLTLVALFVLLPSFDLLKKEAKAAETKKQAAKVEEVKIETQEAVKKIEEMVAKLDPKNEKDEKNAGENNADAKTPEDIRRAAIKKMESMKDKLENLKASNEKALTSEALKDMMKQLRQPGPGPLADVAGAMAKGDFKAAEQALEKMAQAMADGKMSDADKKALEKQLDKMKDALDKLAQNQKKAEEALQKAGLDKELAKASKEDLKKALENAKNLTQEQKEQIQKMVEAQKQAQSQCQNMSQSMNSMCQGMKEGGKQPGEKGMSQEGQKAMQQMGEQLSQAEMMQQEANNLDAALSECQSQMENMMKDMGQCQSPGEGQCQGGLNGEGGESDKGGKWGDNESDKLGKGFGNGGRANGGRPADAQAQEKWAQRKFQTALGNGPVIGTMLVQGDQIRGESKAQFQSAADAADASATEALQNNTIPREYHEAIKHYFGRLKAKVAAEGAAAPAAGTPAPAAAPAGDKK